MPTENAPRTTLLRRKAVEARVGLSRSSLYARIAQGAFPKPVKLGPRAVAWVESEVEHWLCVQIDESRQ